VLVGHSVAGEELRSIGARRSDLIAGLIYLDAAGDRTYSSPKDVQDRTAKNGSSSASPKNLTLLTR
jgi:hypothetical protein